jgi:hypothetical protein
MVSRGDTVTNGLKSGNRRSGNFRFIPEFLDKSTIDDDQIENLNWHMNPTLSLRRHWAGNMLLGETARRRGKAHLGFCRSHAATPRVAADFGPPIRFPGWRARRAARKVSLPQHVSGLTTEREVTKSSEERV